MKRKAYICISLDHFGKLADEIPGLPCHRQEWANTLFGLGMVLYNDGRSEEAVKLISERTLAIPLEPETLVQAEAPC